MLSSSCDCQSLATLMDQNPHLPAKRDFATVCLFTYIIFLSKASLFFSLLDFLFHRTFILLSSLLILVPCSYSKVLQNNMVSFSISAVYSVPSHVCFLIVQESGAIHVKETGDIHVKESRDMN